MQKNILILDSGGRGHALARAFEKSTWVNQVSVFPGNGGASHNFGPGLEQHFPLISHLVDLGKIDLVVPGSEVSLVGGITDYLKDRGIDTFGPSKAAAQLEGSKVFAKRLFDELGIPTAKWRHSSIYEHVRQIIQSFDARVIKADGLCAGKGVLVAQSEQEALDAAHEMIIGKVHGAAGSTIIIEEKLVGRECSVMGICDGKNVVFLLPCARDYKRAYEGDRGPNTGGMGAIAPSPDVDDKLLEWMKEKVFLPILAEMAANGTPYHGILYVGFILTDDGPKVLECNCRPGDPEIQVILEMIESDILPYLFASLEFGGLSQLPPLKIRSGCAVGVVLVSDGYPRKYETGLPIVDHGTDTPDAFLLHAGTGRTEFGELVTTGGRVMNAIGVGANFKVAKAKAYDRADQVNFPGIWYRGDISKGL